MSDKAPTPADFDAYDEEAEQAAIAVAVSEFKVKGMIRGRNFWALCPDGHTYRLPLGLSVNDFQGLTGTEDASIGTLRDLLKRLNPDKTDQILDEPVIVLGNMLAEYGDAIARLQGVDLGKSSA